MKKDVAKNIVLLLLISLNVFIYGFSVFDDNLSIEIIKQAGYWMILVIFLTWFVCAIRWIQEVFVQFKIFKNDKNEKIDSENKDCEIEFRNENCKNGNVSKRNRLKYLFLSRKSIYVILCMIGCFWFMRSHEPNGYKITMDEPLLVGTSMSMHKNRIVMFPKRFHKIEGDTSILGGFVDKRFPFFSFLVCILHDLFGYSSRNAILLNSILTFILLFVAYLTGLAIGRNWKAGISNMLLFACLPLLIQTSHGSGFELLNGLLLFSLFFIGLDFVCNPTKRRLDFLIMTTVLLSLTRYESILFLSISGIYFLISWIQTKKMLTSKIFFLSPIFLFPYLLHNHVYNEKNFWEMKNFRPEDTPFNIKFLAKNLESAIYFLFNPSYSSQNATLISFLGSIAVVSFIVFIITAKLKKIRLKTVDYVLGTFLIGIAIHFMLLLTYYLGFDCFIFQRVSFPLHIGLIVSIIWFVYRLCKKTIFQKYFHFIVLLYIICATLPTIVNHLYTKDYLPGKEINCICEYARKHPENMFISNQGFAIITENVSAILTSQANMRKNEVNMILKKKYYPEINVIQGYLFKKETGKIEPIGDTLSSDFVVEKITEISLDHFVSIEIGRLVDIKNTREMKETFKTVEEYNRWFFDHLP